MKAYTHTCLTDEQMKEMCLCFQVHFRLTHTLQRFEVIFEVKKLMQQKTMHEVFFCLWDITDKYQ